MKVFVDADSAHELINFLRKKSKAHNISVEGETENGYSIISFSTQGKLGRPQTIPKNKIIELRKQGKSYTVIADELGLARSTVALVAKNVKVESQQGTLKPLLPEDKAGLTKLVNLLEWQISRDTNIKDKKIHEETLKLAKEKLDLINTIH